MMDDESAFQNVVVLICVCVKKKKKKIKQTRQPRNRKKNENRSLEGYIFQHYRYIDDHQKLTENDVSKIVIFLVKKGEREKNPRKMEQKTKQKKNKARHWENKKKNKNKYPNPWIHSSSTYGIFLWS